MCAFVIRFSDSPPTVGGQYEQEVVENLAAKLSNQYLILANPNLPTNSSFFYEYDIVVLSPFMCDVIEVKYLYHFVNVYEDWLESINSFHVPAVFSKLETKCKVLKGKFESSHSQLHWKNVPWINSFVLVGPESTKIHFKAPMHKANNKVLKLQDAFRRYIDSEKEVQGRPYDANEWRSFREKLVTYSEKLHENRRGTYKIGKYFIKRCISKDYKCIEYWANDEPPCKVDIHLKEYPFDLSLRQEDTEQYLSEVTRGMQILRSLRHQYIHCVIGHFQTGCSLVQVSDWFRGQPLDACWDSCEGMNLADKVGLMIKIAQGLSYCHSRNVFHRNLSARNILISTDFDDIRLTGFDFAKDFNLSRSVSGLQMNLRDPMIVPPEEILGKGTSAQINLRLYDIYQAGILFYRILENGKWPFNSSFYYSTGFEAARAMKSHKGESGFNELEELVDNMICLKPSDRPDPMLRIEDSLNDIVSLMQ